MKLKLPPFAKVIWNSIVDWWDAWITFEVITLLWIFAQMSVVLGPPFTFGVYYVLNVMIRTGENLGIKGVLIGMKKYFWRGLGWGALNWIVFIVGYINLSFYAAVETNLGFAARVLVIMVVALWVIAQFYALPFFMAQEEEKIFLAIRNGFFMALATPLFSLGIIVFAALLLASCGYLIVPTFFGFPVLIMVLGTRALYDRLEFLGLRKKDPDPREVR